MKKLLTLAFILISFVSFGQIYQPMPQAGYGPIKRMRIDTVLSIPIGITALNNITGGRDTAQLRYNKSDSSLYMYTGSGWVKTTASNIIPALQYNSTPTTNALWKLPDGTRIFTLRGDTTQQSIPDKGVGTSGLNIFMGRSAGNTTVSGWGNNIGFGDSSMANLGSSLYNGDNVAVGAKSMKSNVNGYSSVAIGSYALENFKPTNYYGYNVAVGAKALRKDSTGYYNVAVGYSSMTNLKTGINNVAIGNQSGVFAAGNFNTALGCYALGSDTVAYNSIGVGYYAGAYSKSDTNKLYINSINRVNTNGDSTLSIMYGVQAATITSQRLRLNTNVKITTLGANAPIPSAILDVSSTTQGFLPPRMTTTQKNAITTPAEGLVVYDLTLHKLYTWDGSIWQAAW